MPRKSLVDKLAQLRTQLEATDSLSAEQRSQLQQLVADIEQALEADPDAPEAELSQRTHDIVLKFEAQHPQLTDVLNQLASALANLGI